MHARLHLVDGTYELFRAHYSKRPGHRTPDGRQLKAVVGMVSSLLALLGNAEEAVTHLAVAFDHPIRCFRNRLFAGYKSDEGVDPELRGQFDAALDAARALGLVVWAMDEYEADDALATAAHRYASAFSQVRLLSPDKDLGQCLVGTKVVQVDRLRAKTVDEAALRALRGVGPPSVPDFLALVGDSADGIPGLPGFGEKGAGALLGRYLHLEGIPARAEAWDVSLRQAPKLAATLEAHREDALLYRRLATLVRDVPLSEDVDALGWSGVPRERFLAWVKQVGSTSLAERPHRWA